jgi:rhodanese-related sulfurtransferase
MMRSFVFLSLVLAWLTITLARGGAVASAQEVEILSLSRNGVLTWTNSTLNVTCRVEWAAAAQGPWYNNWASLTNLVITNHVIERPVPMFYRVVSSAPPPPLITNITADVALGLIMSRSSDPNFVILDVRTPSEYATRHVKKAVNINFYDANFSDALSALDKAKTYFVYCASGTRSGNATSLMRQLGFQQVYNMTTGFSTLAGLNGASAYLEP